MIYLDAAATTLEKAGKRQEVAGYRSECQLHALPQRRLVLLLAG